MRIPMEVVVHGIKESLGTFEGKAFSSTTFHCEVDLKENGAGRSMGRVTRPFKIGDAKEFDKWAKLDGQFPIIANAVFEMEATREDGTKLSLIEIAPKARAPKAA
ncbi:hypothetical protein [Comamonas endophytica]|uniref:Uncharacterized protein n=1 Tax=Comamonas endophytica TaxID=2949090 RepID=A0ABY6G8C5_9BURK|nr:MULTISPECIES: hypothetical protein [unclassified Acidovorax]MCD2514566.1 hypothetical protein [Acidovorax sp. D4N7]UYG51143.1 hypothetical protein M9799_13755 [Acidovorax sp. 5MLIR]